MQIVDKRQKQVPSQVKDINTGECFYMTTDLYMKISVLGGHHTPSVVHAVEISSGLLVTLAESRLCRPVKSNIVIEDDL